MKDIKPNMFILGAPKCGTTALANYLVQHSRVGMCNFKEPYFFADEFKNMHKAADIENYKKLYPKSTLSNDIVFEASTHYLMSTSAIDNILKFNPQAKFICMFRNPYELIPSWHDELTYLGRQNQTFDVALKNAEGMHQNILSKQTEYHNSDMMLDYLTVASNGKHVQRLLNKVPASKIQFIKFENFTTDTASIFNNVCEFLNLPIENVELKKVIGRKYHKYPKLISSIRKVGELSKRIGVQRTGLVNKVISLQLNKNKKQREIEYSDYVISHLNKDIKLLESLTNLEVDSWIKK